MKRFMSGFLLGAMLFGVVGAVAVSYVANPVDFKVLVNGQEFISDPPALEVDGRTYLPLRAMGEALGVPVNWNEESRQAEVGAPPTSDNDNYSTGNEVVVSLEQGDYRLTITGVREATKRNEYTDIAADRVIIIDYEYENISSETDVVISFAYFRAYDDSGNSLELYPSTETKSSLNISAGKKHSASIAYALNNGNNKITLDFYEIFLTEMSQPWHTFNLTW